MRLRERVNLAGSAPSRVRDARTGRRPRRRARRSRARRRSPGSARHRPQSWGTEPDDRPAERPLDDVGAQVGRALVAGLTTPTRTDRAISPRSRAASNCARKRAVASTGSTSGVTATSSQSSCSRRPKTSPGPDGPPGRSHTTTSNSARSTGKRPRRPRGASPDTGARARQDAQRRLVHRGEGHGRRRRAGEVLEARATDREAGRDVEAVRVGVHHTNPAPRGNAPGPDRGHVHREPALARRIAGGRDPDRQCSHAGDYRIARPPRAQSASVL